MESGTHICSVVDMAKPFKIVPYRVQDIECQKSNTGMRFRHDDPIPFCYCVHIALLLSPTIVTATWGKMISEEPILFLHAYISRSFSILLNS